MRRIIGLVLTFFMEVKQFMKLLNLVRKRCINFVTVLNQSDLIILSAEVFVRTSCLHFYLVSLDFLFLSEQTAKGISKRERFSDAFVSIFKVFFETVLQSLYPGTFKEFFSTYKRNKDYSCDFLKIMNNHYIDYFSKRFGK